MGGFWAAAPAGVFAMVAACSTPITMDLSENPELYQYTGFRAVVPADRAVFIAPLVDKRRSRAAEASPMPMEYLADDGWDRPVPEMIDRVVRTEVTESQVFAAVRERALPEDCLLKVSLEGFDAAIQELVSSRRSIGAVGLRAQVYGPLVGGERALLLDEVFGAPQASEPSMRPLSPRLLVGRSLHGAVRGMLGKIDQSNVARKNVPLDIQ